MCICSRPGIQLGVAIALFTIGVGLTIAGDPPAAANDQPAFAIRLLDPSTTVPPAATQKPSAPPAAPATQAPPAAAQTPPASAQPPAAQPAPAAIVPVEPPKAAANNTPPRIEPPKTAPFQHREPGRLGPQIERFGENLGRVPSAEPTTTNVVPGPSLPAVPAAPGKLSVDPKAQPAAKADDLKPIPEEDQGPIEIETASFKGVTPGQTLRAELEKNWGTPKELRNEGSNSYFLYAVGPFNRVEVTCHKDRVAALAIRFDKPLPASGVAKQLGLSRIRAVLVSNELGEILGQAYPERGVLLAFEPSAEQGKPSMKVSQIILEPLSAETFVLRAETLLDVQPASSLEDLGHALKLQPSVARAHWLKARLLADMADFEKALTAADEAVRLEPKNAQFRVTRAQVLGQAGQLNGAIEEAKRAVEEAEKRPHIKARALALLGDLTASEPLGDYKRAISYHMDAISTADALMNDRYPAIRVAAKEVLVDAHLGAAHDVAWGNWKDKDKAIVRWVERAKVLADDLIKNDGASEIYRLRVATRAVAACVGARGEVDPRPWTEEAIRVGQSLIATAQDPVRKAQFQWDLGMALYDALQVHQMRGEHDVAMKYGESAIEYLEKGQPRERPAAAYLLGRLYFRIGAVYALRDQNHRAATTWFDKAVPLLERPLPQEAAADLGRHGETFVSMGVSYWETGQREKAVELTQRGVDLMQQAVKKELLSETVLAVGLGNLATMNRTLGKSEAADRYEAMSNRLRRTQR
jgi:tetratricopeptide (TPR) repeat protein